MRKLYSILFLIIILLSFSSCTVSNKTTFHDDHKQSLVMDLEMKEFMDLMKMFGTEKDSSFVATMDDIKKIPRTWTNFYDTGSKIFEYDKQSENKNNDTIKMMKMLMVKSNFVNEEFNGISFKYDKFEPKYIEIFNSISSEGDSKMALPNEIFQNWNKKKLVINTEDFNLKMIRSMMKEFEKDPEMTEEKLKYVFRMFDMKFKNELVFDKKIKSIEGNHDWIVKKDDYTININYNLSDFYTNRIELKNKDKIVTITTE